MAYKGIEWNNNETPLSAQNMNRIERGLESVSIVADSAKLISEKNSSDIDNINNKDLGSNNIINNEGESKPSLVSGTNNLVGAKAYSFSSYSVDTSTNQTIVTLSKIDGDINGSLKDQEVSMLVSDNGDAFGKVISVDAVNKQIVIDAIRVDRSLDSVIEQAGIKKTVDGTVTTYSGFTDDNKYVDNIIFFPFLTDSDGNWKTIGTRNIGTYCFAAGSKNAALSTSSSVVGWQNNAEGRFSFVSGRLNKGGYASLVAGRGNRAMGNCAAAVGTNNNASGRFSFAAGNDSVASQDSSIALGDHARATAVGAFASGHSTSSSGVYTFTSGNNTKASASYAHAEGNGTTASGESSHSEGFNSTASAIAAHAEGRGTASGANSHAEGASKATKDCAHAEGRSTEANGDQSHAEGLFSVASGQTAHAEGWSTQALKAGSHSSGMGTKATRIGQTVVGIANKQDDEAVFIVGNGDYSITDNKVVVNKESNAFVVRKNGDVLAGGQKVLTSVPIASATVSGTIKVGSGLSISGGVLSATGSGGSLDQVQSDFNQNDSTKVDYIKNRTHWEDVEIDATYEVPYVSGTSITVGEYGAYISTTSIPDSIANLTFLEGDIVYCSDYTVLSGGMPSRAGTVECIVGDVIPEVTGLDSTFGFGVYKDNTDKAPAYIYSVNKLTGKIIAVLRLEGVSWSSTQLKTTAKTYHKLSNNYIDTMALLQLMYPVNAVFNTADIDLPAHILAIGQWQLLETSEPAYKSYIRIS